MKMHEHDAGHMTKIAALYSQPVAQFPQSLICSIGDSSPSYFVLILTFG